MKQLNNILQLIKSAIEILIYIALLYGMYWIAVQEEPLLKILLEGKQ